MIKNMTRKGLAIGSAAALMLAGLVGIAAPAQANTIVLEPRVGNSYSVPLDATFDLKTYFGVGANTFNDPLKITVIDATESILEIELGTVHATTGAFVPESTPVKDTTRNATTKAFDVSVASPVAGTEYAVRITPVEDLEDTFTATVQASFARAGSSAVRTVTFHRAADYTWNLSFTTPVVGDSKFGAVVSTTPKLNFAQFASKVKVGFAEIQSSGDLIRATAQTSISADAPPRKFNNGTAASVTTDVSRQADGSYKWAVAIDNQGPTNKIVSTKTYAAQILYGSAEVGTRQIIKPAADTIVKLTTPALVKTANTKGNDIRLGTTSVTVETVAYKTWHNTVTADRVFTPAGETINVVVTKSSGGAASFDTLARVEGGGKTLTNTTAGGKIEITATVGANGKVSIPLTLTGLKAGNEFSVAVAAQNADATPSNNLSATYKVAATAAQQMVDHNLMGGGAIWKVTHGTYTLRFAVLDNFDQPLAGAGYRVTLKNGLTADDTSEPVVNGVATFTVNTKNSADDAVSAFTAQLEKASGLTWGNAENNGSTVVVGVNIGASNAASAVTVSDGTTTAAAGNKFTLPASSTFALNLKDLKAANTRLGESAPTIGALGATLSGSVSDANGVGTYGNVTISAPGLMFAANTPGSKVFSLDSITVQTNAIGQYDGVEVYSNKAGKVAVTVTSGGASQVVTLTFAAAHQATGTALSVNVANAVPGSTMVVSGSLVDDFGNAVKTSSDALRIVYTGPGFRVGDLPTRTDEDGKFEFRVLLGTSDVITGSVTVTYSPSGSTADDITVTRALSATAAAGVARAWTRDMGDGTIKVYARDVVGAGKVQFFHNGTEVAWIRAVDATDPKLNVASDGMVRTRALVSGRNVFEIYVDGERIVRRIATGS